MNKKRDIAILIITILVFAAGLILGLMPKEPYTRAYGYMSNFLNPPNTLDKDFREYVGDDDYTTTLGSPLFLYELEKDKTVNNLTNIVLTVFIHDDKSNPNKEKNWAMLSPDEKKRDLRECANLVEDFLKSKNVSYNCNIYVNVERTSRLGYYVYCKTSDLIWIPPCEETSKSDIKDIDISYNEEGYNVCILDGEFTEIGEKTDSIQY